MKEDIIRLIREGLFQDNLVKLIDLTKRSLDKDPSLYFILNRIFVSLEKEYDDQAISKDRYDKVMILVPLIMNALESDSKRDLDVLIIAFSNLA